MGAEENPDARPSSEHDPDLWVAVRRTQPGGPEEMLAMAHELQGALRRANRPTPHFDRLLALRLERP